MKKTFIFLCASMVLQATASFATTNEPVKENVVYNTTKSNETDTKWEFYSAHEDPSPELLEGITSNKYSKRVSYFYNLFKDTYVVKEEVVPGDPTRRTVIRKPEIYNAVKSIEKALNKSVKKHEISEKESEQLFYHVLKVSLAAIDSESDSFEESLDAHRKDTKALLALFQQVNLKDLY